jgi:transposase-like protein
MPQKPAPLSDIESEYPCSGCGSTHKVKNGWNGNDPRYKCKNCGRNYIMRERRPRTNYNIGAQNEKIRLLMHYMKASRIEAVAHKNKTTGETTTKYRAVKQLNIRRMISLCNSHPATFYAAIKELKTLSSNLDVETLPNELKTAIKNILGGKPLSLDLLYSKLSESQNRTFLEFIFLK